MLVWNRPALLFISLRLAAGAMGHGPEMFQTFNQQHNPLQKFGKISKTYGALRQGLRWDPMGPMGQPLKKTTTYIHKPYYIHGVSEKTVQNCFWQTFVKFPSILIIFGRYINYITYNFSKMAEIICYISIFHLTSLMLSRYLVKHKSTKFYSL